MLILRQAAFQSTLPCGSDIRMTTNPSTSSDFNPRSLAGATPYGQSFSSVGDRFQSTLPCGSDLLLSFQPLAIDNFNPRSLAGATTANSVPRQSIINFNPRSLAGATGITPTQNTGFRDFNPRSLAGATLIDLVLSAVAVFQSTLPCGSDFYEPLTEKRFDISIHAPLRERPNSFCILARA